MKHSFFSNFKCEDIVLKPGHYLSDSLSNGIISPHFSCSVLNAVKLGAILSLNP